MTVQVAKPMLFKGMGNLRSLDSNKLTNITLLTCTMANVLYTGTAQKSQ